MTKLIHLYSETDRLQFECSDDEPTIWIRSSSKPTVSIDLSQKSARDELRAALDTADLIAELEA
jgi:hypothetical protein